jgi:DNA mismatch endonuclease (patch repair protein)
MKSNVAKNTSPEKSLRSALFAAGILGYRLHVRGVPGRPDIVFRSKKVAVFVNGCFWHRCPRCALPMPKTHAAFWRKKFKLNQQRDDRKTRALRSMGWRVVTIWECEIREDLGICVKRVKRAL